MQILSTYKLPSSAMIEFDYLKNSLVYLYAFNMLNLDTFPTTPRKPKYQANKPRSSYANPVCIPAPYKHNDRV